MNKADKVECLECHKKFSVLTVHLSMKHQLNVVEYRKKYPEAPVTSKAFRSHLSQGLRKARSSQAQEVSASKE